MPADLQGFMLALPKGDTSWYRSVALEDLKRDDTGVPGNLSRDPGTHIFLEAQNRRGRLLLFHFYYKGFGTGVTGKGVITDITMELLLRDGSWHQPPQGLIRAKKHKDLVKYLADCPAVVAQIREKKLDVSPQMKKIVRRYNACFDQ